ncbi:MAG TPA: efflux RND transporter periplasmic adaptor subunit [Longimicrobium sp.]|nr:efflux RND transporter periplasmic adaptor subunit [Longimicrobium sp.]
MKIRDFRRPSAGVKSVVLLGTLAVAGGGLVMWKAGDVEEAQAAAASQPEPVETVTGAVAVEREHRAATTSIGTVLATRSIELRNEVPGTVRFARLAPGQVVGAGTVLIALDASVEEAELRALQAQAELARTTVARMERMYEQRAVSAMEVDNARAERDVAVAQMARIRAVIARKTIRAPFRARVGMADVHPGQFLDAGTVLTTLQGVDDAANVDFAVAQDVAAGLRPGDPVEVLAGEGQGTAVPARITAVDARVDPSTRSATVRARITGAGANLAPGGSVRVRVAVGAAQTAVAVPVSALRKGPGGDHVFVLETNPKGETRARMRPVQAGPVLGGEVVILSGVTAGERVAASGSFKLREQALVNVSGGPVAAAAATGGK